MVGEVYALGLSEQRLSISKHNEAMIRRALVLVAIPALDFLFFHSGITQEDHGPMETAGCSRFATTRARSVRNAETT